MKKLIIIYLCSTAISLGSTSVKAEYLRRTPLSDSTLYNEKAYNNGAYMELSPNSLQRSSLYESTIKDKNGNLYDCGSLGYCRKR